MIKTYLVRNGMLRGEWFVKGNIMVGKYLNINAVLNAVEKSCAPRFLHLLSYTIQEYLPVDTTVHSQSSPTSVSSHKSKKINKDIPTGSSNKNIFLAEILFCQTTCVYMKLI